MCVSLQSWKQIIYVYIFNCFWGHVVCSLRVCIIPHHPSSVALSSYLQPGGEREWKVERENISALSAIFFHKWLRATAENHGWSAVHSQSQDRGQSRPWTEGLSLRGPTDVPWPQAFDQTSLLSTIKSAFNHPHERGRRGVWINARNDLQKQRTAPRRSKLQSRCPQIRPRDA